MLFYLIDASVAVEFYQPKSAFHTPTEYKHSLDLRYYITQQKSTGKATIFIPSFCIAEVRNTLAKWYFRSKNVFSSKQHYDTAFGTFISHVHDRKFFYSYDLNRYHNLNTNVIAEIEHTTDTEFDATGLSIGTDSKLINEKLRQKNPKGHVGHYHLGTLDILIIAMGMELKRITGEEVYLLTSDKRLSLISSKKPEEFPKSYYWPTLKISDLPKT
ncbi:MAG: hypothetical protein V2A65_09105 [Candidatus Omnitrophota bacterium]